MITVRCTYGNGDTVDTRINLTFDEARAYFLGHRFNVGIGPSDNMQTCVSVEPYCRYCLHNFDPDKPTECTEAPVSVYYHAAS
jgi:hypothetical protein